MSRTWDGASYDRISAPMEAMGREVLDRLELRGDETVLDAGCGSGRVTEALVERLPAGRVIGIDASPEMVAAARERLGDRAELRVGDLLELSLDEPCDAILSTATFHWVADHARLFRRLRAALRPGGQLVAQCGGRGNIDAVRRAGAELVRQPPFAEHFAGWTDPWHYEGPEETAERLHAAGFGEARTWLQERRVRPSDPHGWLRTIVLGAQVQRLPEPLAGDFVARVIERIGAPVELRYMRLNIDARAA